MVENKLGSSVMIINGWRRLAIVMSSIWFLGAVSLTIYEVFNHQDGFFVGRTLPAGTVVTGNKATLPSGQVVDLDTVIDGKTVKPWEIKWDDQPEVPTEKFIRWFKLLTFGIALPLVIVGILEVIGFIGNWVLKGFRK